MDERAVAAAVEETAGFLRPDGADLHLVRSDPKTSRIELSLELADSSCEECVLPPEMLRQTVTAALRRRIRGEFELVIRDPRC